MNDGATALGRYSQTFGQAASLEEYMQVGPIDLQWGPINNYKGSGNKLSGHNIDIGLSWNGNQAHDLANSLPGRTKEKHQSQMAATAEDSDGEVVCLCSHCQLPRGEACYKRDGKYFHGECIAQLMARDACKEVKARQHQDAAYKQQRRKEYDIGWDASRIPRNDGHASTLAQKAVKQGMVCLMLEESTNSVRIASTNDPATAVNLEYLSVALRVRRSEGHEPIFSLNPTNINDMHTMQSKVFTPAWLAGTRVGDVLFEADYHLKELSMGEYEQPVTGMKSTFEFLEMEGFKDDWKAREWFMVRKAEVQLAENNVLIPYVRMGVEARELVSGSNGIEDAPITRPDHPMVKYAEQFTHAFDLIAERKSVIFHLRELAKASVMAKYLIESSIDLEEEWFELPCENDAPCSLEVPQLWNEHEESAIELKDGKVMHEGKIMKAGKGTSTTRLGIYGGVDLGLNRFKLARGMESQLSTGLELSGMTAFARSSDMRPRTAPGLRGQQRMKGVDLRLDQFDLTAPKRVMLEAPYGSWCDTAESLEACAPLADQFWAGLAKASTVFRKEDLQLLRAVFNKSMSDRSCEGDVFAPPDASYSYVMKLRGLVKEEQEVRQKRKDHFFGKQFAIDSPGVLFPRSWSSLSEVSHLPERVPQGSLHARHDYNAEELEHTCVSVSPVFEKATEDGLIFRIYRMGSLEVRTIQEPEAHEAIGAVYSICAPTLRSDPSRMVKDGEAIIKVTEFVERMHGARENEIRQRPQNHYYVVLETSKGCKLVTELMPSGSLVWQENPDELDDRNSLARVTRTAECAAGAIVSEIKAYWQSMMHHSKPASHSMRKQYARNVFNVSRRRNPLQQGIGNSMMSHCASSATPPSGTNVARASMRSAMWRTPFKC